MNVIKPVTDTLRDERVTLLTREIRAFARRTAEGIVEIGNRLTEVKFILGHGQFGHWLREEFGWTHQTANNFMNVARQFGENPKLLEFPPSVLYMLASNGVPQGAVDEVVHRSELGTPITCRLAKTIIEEIKNDVRLKTIEQHTPPIIHELLEDGTLSIESAYDIGQRLQTTIEPVRQLVAKWGIADASLVPILERLSRNGSETFDELWLSGCIQPGEEDEAIPLQTCSTDQLQNYLDFKRREHMLQGIAQHQSASTGRPTKSPMLCVGSPDLMPDIENVIIDLIILSVSQIHRTTMNELYRVACQGASLFLHRQVADPRTTFGLGGSIDLDSGWIVRQEIIWDCGKSTARMPGYFHHVDERILWLTKGEAVLQAHSLGQSSIWRPPNPDFRHISLAFEELTRRVINAVGHEGLTVLFPDPKDGKALMVAKALGCDVVGIVKSIDEATVLRSRFSWKSGQ